MVYGRKTGRVGIQSFEFRPVKPLIKNGKNPLFTSGIEPRIIAILDWDIYISFNLYSLQEIK